MKKDHSPELLAHLAVLRAERKPADLSRPEVVRALMDPDTGLYKHFSKQIIEEVPTLRKLEELGGRPPEGGGEGN